jgi:hypothetical protein
MSIPPASAAPGMPSSSIPVPDPRERLRRGARAVLAAAVLILGMLAAVSARADVIVVKSAELRAEEDGYYLNAEFEFSLNSTLDEALQKGVPLYFLLEFEISRPRWYWLDEKVVSSTTQYRVSYNALTRQYRIASGLLGLTFESLDEVERFLSRVTAREVARRDQLAKGTRYEAALRLRLDVNQLPKPFQMSALASREWTLASEWYRWSFTP